MYHFVGWVIFIRKQGDVLVKIRSNFEGRVRAYLVLVFEYCFLFSKNTENIDNIFGSYFLCSEKH